MRRSCLAWVMAGVWVCACGDSGNGTGGETDTTESTSEGTEGTTEGGDGLCAGGNTSVTGTADGADVNSSGERSARLLNQISDPPSLALSWDGGNATFQWVGLANSATPIDVTGIITVDGSSYCFGSGTLTIDDAGYDTFSVGDLSQAPSNDVAMCPGSVTVAGELEGCSDAG